MGLASFLLTPCLMFCKLARKSILSLCLFWVLAQIGFGNSDELHAAVQVESSKQLTTKSDIDLEQPVVLFVARAMSASQLSAYDKVARGFEETSLATLESIIVQPMSDDLALMAFRQSLSEKLSGRNARTAVVWGAAGIGLLAPLKKDFPVLAVGLTQPGQETFAYRQEISRFADPAVLVDKAVELVPTIKTVHVVADTKASDWILAYMRRELAKQRMTLQVHAAATLEETAQAYQRVLMQLNPAEEAVWLPPLQPYGAQALLPLVLKSAWKRRIVTFSNHLNHVEQGVFLGVTMNLSDYGSELASIEQSMHVAQSSREARHFASRSARLAINARTAARLGLKLMPHHLEDVEMVLPK